MLNLSQLPRLAAATSVIAVLAIAAPAAQAATASSTATIPAVDPALTYVAAAGDPSRVAIGPTIIDSVFNGPTSIVTSTLPATG